MELVNLKKIFCKVNPDSAITSFFKLLANLSEFESHQNRTWNVAKIELLWLNYGQISQAEFDKIFKIELI